MPLLLPDDPRNPRPAVPLSCQSFVPVPVVRPFWIALGA
jgi:hypothetical protein